MSIQPLSLSNYAFPFYISYMHGLQLMPQNSVNWKKNQSFKSFETNMCILILSLLHAYMCFFFFSCGCNCSGNLSFVWHSPNTVFDTHNIKTVWNSYKLITINNKGGKFLNCGAASVGDYNKIILVYQLRWSCALATVKSFKADIPSSFDFKVIIMFSLLSLDLD